MLVQRFSGCAFARIVFRLHDPLIPASLVQVIVVVQSVSFGDVVGHAEQLRGAVVSLHRLTFRSSLIPLPAHVHAFMRKHRERPQFLVASAAGMA
jgi:hypothetical protein